MTLADVGMDVPSRISGFRALSESDKARLGALGLRVGMPVLKVLRTPLRDPIECLVGPQLLALENWLLERIEVELT